MICELCGKDRHELLLVPRRQDDDKLASLDCRSCAREGGYLCERHDQVHLALGQGLHVCPKCIDLEVANRLEYANSYTDRLTATLPEGIVSDLWARAQLAATIKHCTVATAILRFLATAALRTGQTVEVVLETVIASQSIDLLFPAP